MKRFFVAVCCALVVAIVFGSPSHAQSAPNNTLTVGPSVTDISLNAGTSIDKRFTAVNQGKQTFVLKLSVAPYAVANEQYEATFEQIPGRTPVQDWISLSGVDTMTLEPGKYYDVNFNVRVPEGTPAGGYSAVIFAESSVSKNVVSGVQVRNRIAHIVYVNVSGEVKQSGRIDVTSGSVLRMAGNQLVRYSAVNDGGSNEKVTIKTAVKDIFGRNVFSNATERYVLPGTKRALDVTWPSHSFFGVYQVTSDGQIANTPYTSSYWVMTASPLFIVCVGAILFVIIWRYAIGSNRVKHRKR